MCLDQIRENGRDKVNVQELSTRVDLRAGLGAGLSQGRHGGAEAAEDRGCQASNVGD